MIRLSSSKRRRRSGRAQSDGAAQAEPAVAVLAPERRTSAPARRNKTMIAGYFTPDLARAVKLLAVERGVTIQALIGEGLDDMLCKYGKRPMGER